MTLIELGVAGMNLTLGVIGGYYGCQWYGWIGAIVGSIAAVSGNILFIVGSTSLALWWHERGGVHPICRNGVCNSADYQCLGPERTNLVYQCRCGTKYTFKGRRFFVVLPNGDIKPFMRKGWFRGWEPDDEEQC
jgi:hypothetical protein